MGDFLCPLVRQLVKLGYLGWVGIINMIRLAHERYQITKGMDSILFLRTFIDYFASSMLRAIYLLSAVVPKVLGSITVFPSPKSSITGM